MASQEILECHAPGDPPKPLYKAIFLMQGVEYMVWIVFSESALAVVDLLYSNLIIFFI